jgi:ketosteroid isomerase-like protein
LSVFTVSSRPLGQTDAQTQIFDWAWIVSVRDEKITRVRSFFDKGRAFEAAGLRE